MVATGVLSVAVLLHGLLGFIHFPYYFTYYNPLTGGSRTAPHVLFVGWGEGLDQAAAWLNQQENVEGQRTVAWYHDGPLSYFYDGQAAGVGSGSPLLWLDTDYTVVYVNQRQRQIPSPAAMAYFDGLEPAYIVSSRGLELARIYDMRATSLPEFIDIGKESAADFGNRIRLSAYDLSETSADPGEEIEATLYLQAIDTMEENYNVLVRVISPDGNELWREEGWPWGAATTDWPLREIRPDGHTIAIPPDATPGLYKLVVSFYDPTTLDALPVTAVGSDELLNDSERDIALIEVKADPGDEASKAGTWQFGETFALSATAPRQGAAGRPLNIDLHWQSLSPTSTDYTVFVHIIGPDGATVAQQDRPPLHGFAPTRTWQSGQQIDDEFIISLPEDLPTGEYEVRVGLYTLDGGRLTAIENGEPSGDHVVIGRFDVP